MAFKKNPDAESFVGPAEAFGLDKVQFDGIVHFIAVFWPAIVGGVALFTLVVIGRERMAMLVAAIMVPLQAWLLGLFG
jgi:hypothetical protein